MSARVADSDTSDAILESFKIIAGDKSFVTESDMRSVMEKDQASDRRRARVARRAHDARPPQVDFLVANMPKNADGYDYVAWGKMAYA